MLKKLESYFFPHRNICISVLLNILHSVLIQASVSKIVTSAHKPFEISMFEGIEPFKFNSVCNLIAPLFFLDFAYGKTDKHKSIVVLSKAYTTVFNFLEISESFLYN